MTTRDLEIFMTVAECGKMCDAAKLLFISQSSVSQAIANIEREYDILLFERLSKGLFLTPNGIKLLSYAKRIFSVEREMNIFLETASRTKSLRVGASITVGTCVLSPILLNVEKLVPGVEFSVSVANTSLLEGMLLRNEIDIGLVEGEITESELISKNVMKDELVLVCGRKDMFFGRSTVRPEELAGRNLILREIGSGTRAIFENQMKTAGYSYSVRWSCYNSEAIRNAVSDGHGISVISKRLVEDDVNQGRLWACNIADMDLTRFFSVVYHRDKNISEEMTQFIVCCSRYEYGKH